MLKLWLISQEENRKHDTFDCAVVAAEDEAQARALHPSGDAKWMGDADWQRIGGGKELPYWRPREWTHPANVTAKLIGDALPDAVEGVICASFNAG